MVSISGSKRVFSIFMIQNVKNISLTWNENHYSSNYTKQVLLRKLYKENSPIWTLRWLFIQFQNKRIILTAHHTNHRRYHEILFLINPIKSKEKTEVGWSILLRKATFFKSYCPSTSTLSVLRLYHNQKRNKIGVRHVRTIKIRNFHKFMFLYNLI